MKKTKFICTEQIVCGGRQVYTTQLTENYRANYFYFILSITFFVHLCKAALGSLKGTL